MPTINSKIGLRVKREGTVISKNVSVNSINETIDSMNAATNSVIATIDSMNVAANYINVTFN